MIHVGKNSRSMIVSKGISAGKSRNCYRGLVQMGPQADGAQNFLQCDSMLIGTNSCGGSIRAAEMQSGGSVRGRGANRLQIFSPNKLEEKKESKLLKFIGFMWNPLSWVIEMAVIMAITLANGDRKPLDWQDFVGIVVLLVINLKISFIKENSGRCSCYSNGWICS